MQPLWRHRLWIIKHWSFSAISVKCNHSDTRDFISFMLSEQWLHSTNRNYYYLTKDKNISIITFGRRPKCIAKLSILIKDPIKTKKTVADLHFHQTWQKKCLWIQKIIIQSRTLCSQFMLCVFNNGLKQMNKDRI